MNELYNKIEGFYADFKENHEKYVAKGNKAAEARARKAIIELKNLITPYRQASVLSTKGKN